MRQIEKTIFSSEYFTFRDLDKIINNCGVLSKNGYVVILERFQNVMYNADIAKNYLNEKELKD